LCMCIFASKYLRGASEGTTYFHVNICVCVCAFVLCVWPQWPKKCIENCRKISSRGWYVCVDIVGTHIIQMHIHTTVFSFQYGSRGLLCIQWHCGHTHNTNAHTRTDVCVWIWGWYMFNDIVSTHNTNARLYKDMWVQIWGWGGVCIRWHLGHTHNTNSHKHISIFV